MKKVLLLLLFTTSFARMHGLAQTPSFQGDLKELFAGPASDSVRDGWLKDMKNWRLSERSKLQFDNAEYLRRGSGWMRETFVFAQMMAHDRFFYDPALRKYTVDKYLNDLKIRYGGIDAVLIWPAYPNMGIDNRNQYDLVAAMPGGLKALKKMVADFKRRRVRVFFPIMYWDRGTRPVTDAMHTALVKEMKLIGADGLNGDTMFGVTEDFMKASRQLHYPLALQPEVSINDLKMVQWNQLSWGYYWPYRRTPGVSVYKWLEPMHQVNITNRWITNKTDDLQYAFFNGIGFNSWENIWGVWNQIPDRFAAALRRISLIYRQFPDMWSAPGWEPFIPTIKTGVYASVFPAAGQAIYTLVNRDSADKQGAQLKFLYDKKTRYFDLWNGKEIIPQTAGNNVYLSFTMEGNGFGAILATKSRILADSLKVFMREMNHLSRKPLKCFSSAWAPLSQKLVAVQKTPAVSRHRGMIRIPAANNYTFESVGIMIEGNELPNAVGIQHPWEKHPARSQKHVMNIQSFYIDKYPVTNKEFKHFLVAAKYHPKNRYNFLKHWENGMYPPQWANKPVTWVSVEDARAYAKWAGKRLPHEWEWQYAAQGQDGRLYPWGNNKEQAREPAPDTSRIMRPPTDVDAFPNGASPFGIIDMVGNVWQLTDEYIDRHTRAVILKGGSYYKPQTSAWYFPQAAELNQYGKYLLMAPSLDRSGTIGFRCVSDVK